MMSTAILEKGFDGSRLAYLEKKLTEKNIKFSVIRETISGLSGTKVINENYVLIYICYEQYDEARKISDPIRLKSNEDPMFIV